ncbi:MAG: FG-GAP repeat protein [Firmicutes bacterium]|nr:FG-GAP repeat protein [Bacillota bacterium]
MGTKKRKNNIIRLLICCLLISATFTAGLVPVQVSALTDQNNRLETLNLGTDLVPFDDDTDVSDTDILGFDLKREGTESEKYGDRNLMNDVIGAVPGELVIMNEDNAFNLTDLDFLKTSNINLPDYGKNNREDYRNFIGDDDAFISAKRSSYGALRAIDIDRNGLDDLVYLTEEGEIQFYDATRLKSESGYKGGKIGEFNDPLYKFQLSETKEQYLANQYPDSGKASTKDTDRFLPILHDINENHMEVGDIDGNGCEDVVVFYYGANGPVMEIYYLFYLEYRTLHPAAINGLPAGWTGCIENGGPERTLDNMIAYHQVVDLSLKVKGDYYGHLPASLKVADLSGDGLSEIILAYQEGNPASNGGIYRTNIAVYHSEKDKDIKISLLKDSDETHTFTQPKLSGDVFAWEPDGKESSQMTSVEAGDVDNDGYAELVVGGYAGENALDGKLYLCYLEWNFKNSDDLTGYLDKDNVYGFTWLTGNEQETSLFIDDDDSKFFSAGDAEYTLSRHVTYSNWTVPLTAVSIFGYVGNKTCDQVQFGNNIYKYNDASGSFSSCLDIEGGIGYNAENNNVTLLLSESTISEEMLPQCSDEDALDQMINYEGQEVLYQAAVMNTNDNTVLHEHSAYFKDGNKIIINSFNDTRTREKTGSSSNTDDDLYNLTEKDSFTTPVIGNFEIEEKTVKYTMNNATLEKAVGVDADSLILKLVGHEFTYTEPVVESVLIAPPTFEDVYAATGYDSGATFLTNIEGTSTEGSISARVAFDFELAAKLKLRNNKTEVGTTPGFAVSPAYQGGTTKDSQFSVSTAMGQDTVVLASVPVDTYYYEIIRPGTKQTSNDYYDYEVLDYAVLQMPSSPQIQTVSFNKYKKMVEEYNDRTAKYNEDMNAYSEESGLESFTELPYLPEVSEFAAHTWGKPHTYKKVADLDEDAFGGDSSLLTLNYSDQFGATTQSLLRTWNKQDGYNIGGELTAGFKFEKGNRFTKFSLGATGTLSGMGGQTFYEGTAYRGDLKSISEEWNDFGMQVSMYSGKKEAQMASADGLKASEYTIVGYEAHNVKYGTAVVDKLEVKSVKADEITLEVTLPWDSEHAAKSYILQRFNSNTHKWETIHTFKEPNKIGDKEAVTETFVDKGGSDGSGKEETLEADTTYRYRITDALQKHAVTAQGTTKKVNLYDIHYQELFNWGLPLARAKSATTGWVTLLTDGATIEEGSKITYTLHPFEACSVKDVKVLETADGTEIDITTSDRVNKVTTSRSTRVTIDDVQGDIMILADGDNPNTVLKDDTWDMILECNGFTIYDYEAGELNADGDKPLPITVKEAKQITDDKAKLTIKGKSGLDSITLFMQDSEGELYTKLLRPSANGTIEFELSDLPDGQYYIAAVAKHKAADDEGNPQISVKYLPINKDTSGNGENVVPDDGKNVNNNSDKGTDTGDDGVPLLAVILCMISVMIIMSVLLQRRRQSRS